MATSHKAQVSNVIVFRIRHFFIWLPLFTNFSCRVPTYPKMKDRNANAKYWPHLQCPVSTTHFIRSCIMEISFRFVQVSLFVRPVVVMLWIPFVPIFGQNQHSMLILIKNLWLFWKTFLDMAIGYKFSQQNRRWWWGWTPRRGSDLSR